MRITSVSSENLTHVSTPQKNTPRNPTWMLKIPLRSSKRKKPNGVAIMLHLNASVSECRATVGRSACLADGVTLYVDI